MIFVTVGTNEAPFDRLVEAIASIVGEESVVAQCGSSTIRPSGVDCLEFISFDRLVEFVREARVVVTHAGVGSILVSLSNGKRPIVVPRKKRFGEAVDDHQVSLTSRLATAGLVSAIDDPGAELAAAVLEHDGVPTFGAASTALARDLRSYLLSIC